MNPSAILALCCYLPPGWRAQVYVRSGPLAYQLVLVATIKRLGGALMILSTECSVDAISMMDPAADAMIASIWRELRSGTLKELDKHQAELTKPTF